jgi:hypothetical protein
MRRIVDVSLLRNGIVNPIVLHSAANVTICISDRDFVTIALIQGEFSFRHALVIAHVKVAILDPREVVFRAEAVHEHTRVVLALPIDEQPETISFRGPFAIEPQVFKKLVGIEGMASSPLAPEMVAAPIVEIQAL